MTNRSIVLLLLLVSVISTKGFAQTITMATVDWQPFQGQDLPGYGFTAEIARQALARKGHGFSLEFIPWARAIEEVKKGRYHALFNCWRNSGNDQMFVFSQEIMASGAGHFLALPGSEYKDLDPFDLTGMRIGYIRGYEISDELMVLIGNGKIDAVEVTEVNQLLGMLQKGRIDIILENHQVAGHVFAVNNPGKPFELEIVGRDLGDGGLYIGWSKENPKSEMLRDQFDEAIREMREDGTIAKIRQAYGI